MNEREIKLIEYTYLMAIGESPSLFESNEIIFVIKEDKVFLGTKRMVHDYVSNIGNPKDLAKSICQLFEYGIYNLTQILEAEEDFGNRDFINEACDKYHSLKDDSL